MKKDLFSLFLVLFLVSVNYYLLTDQVHLAQDSGQVQGANSISLGSNVSLTIGGKYRFSLFGYTSPRSLVTLDGVGINLQTYSDDTGYFIFTNNFSPISPKETCLTSQDQFGRLSPPTCLAPFTTQDNVSIGPVILPPTLSLDKNDYFIGDEVILSGQTIPDSDVNLSMFTKEGQASNLKVQNWRLPSIIKPVEAFTFPQLQLKADNKGNFAISLPSSQVDNFRMFAQTMYDKLPSAQSNTLNLSILPIWMIILKILWLVFQFFKPKLIEIAIVIELALLLVYIFRRYFQPHIIARNRSLALRENITLLEEEKTLLVVR